MKNVRFDINGSGQTFGPVKKEASDLGLKNVRFLGKTPFGEIPWHIAEADACIGILGSTEKASRVIPNKVYECAAMGKPIITGDSPAIREVFTDGKDMLFCALADASSLADKIRLLIKDPALRRTLSIESAETFRKRCSPKIIVARAFKRPKDKMNEFAERYNQDALVYGVSSTRKRKIFEMIDPRGEPADILDIGCGVGLLGKELRSKGNKVSGVDISGSSIEKAKKNLDAAFVCDIQNDKLPFPDCAFDAVLFTEVIEHLPFPEKAMAEIGRVLKPGGSAIITTPNFLVWSNRIHMLFGRFEYADTGFFDRGHVHFFTRRSLISAIKKAGLRAAAWNNVYHGKIPESIGKLRPSLFAFQFVVKAVKT